MATLNIKRIGNLKFAATQHTVYYYDRATSSFVALHLPHPTQHIVVRDTHNMHLEHAWEGAVVLGFHGERYCYRNGALLWKCDGIAHGSYHEQFCVFQRSYYPHSLLVVDIETASMLIRFDSPVHQCFPAPSGLIVSTGSRRYTFHAWDALLVPVPMPKGIDCVGVDGEYWLVRDTSTLAPFPPFAPLHMCLGRLFGSHWSSYDRRFHQSMVGHDSILHDQQWQQRRLVVNLGLLAAGGRAGLPPELLTWMARLAGAPHIA